MSGSSENIEELLATSFNRKCGSPNRMSESIEAQVGKLKRCDHIYKLDCLCSIVIIILD